MKNDREEQGRKLGEVIKKAWEDEAFMAGLLADATTVLKEQGIQLPEGMKVQAITNSETLSYWVVPPKPQRNLTESELDIVAGGYCPKELPHAPPSQFCLNHSIPGL